MQPLLVLQSAQQPAGLAGLATSLFPFLLLLFIGWFLLFKPMLKEKKEKEAMRDSLKAGDRILSIGGLYGTVTKVGERSINMKIADGVQVELARTAIASIVQPESKE